jgi:membrane fusion protein (multidrug efflux system)
MDKKDETLTEDTEAKRVVKKRHIALFVITGIIIASLAGLLWFSTFETTYDWFVEAHIVRISPKVTGIIDKLYIDDNQLVKKGDLLLTIDDRDYKVKYEQAEAAYKMALYKQKSAVVDRKSSNIDMGLAQRDYERYLNLYSMGAVSKQEMDNAKSKYELTKAKNAAVEQTVLSGSKNKVADAELERLAALKEQAKLELSYTKIYAPEDGKITNRSAEAGAFVNAGTPLFSIVPEKRWIVANFKETQLNKIRVGQDVIIKVDAYPGLKIKGKVSSIQSSTGAKTSLFPPENAVGSYVKIVQRVPVKIEFTEKVDSQYSIEPGMSVVPKVLVK